MEENNNVLYFEKYVNSYDESVYVRIKDTEVDINYIDDYMNSHDVNRIYEVSDKDYYLLIKEFSGDTSLINDKKITYNAFTLTGKDEIDKVLKYVNDFTDK